MRRHLFTGIVVGAVLAVMLLTGRSAETIATAAKSPTDGLTKLQQRLASGTASAMLDAQPAGIADQRQSSAAPAPASASGCPVDRGSNVRVNQDCQNLTDTDVAGRGQAQNETAVAADPSRPSSLVASSNDYRRGDSSCITSYSHDNGRSWRDSTPPMSFTRGDAFGGGVARQYWQSGGDTSLAWDTKGNAYLSCLMFMRGQPVTANPDTSSGLYVFRSTGSRGASWNFPARPVAEFDDTAGSGAGMLDKQYLTVDDHAGSPFQDRVYVTWTFFAPDGTSYIYGAYSADYGEHFSAPVLVSADAATCAETLDVPTPQGRCNTNQYSQPFTGPDGALYVVWNNANATNFSSAADNRSQVLLSKSTDGGRTFAAPVKVADYYELPDCLTYQGTSAFVACVPEKGATSNSIFRASNYPSGAVNPQASDEIAVSFGSYVNGNSNVRNGCEPRGFNTDTLLPLYEGVKTPGACNNDILTSVSRDAGKTFTGGSADVRTLPTVRPHDPRADQFWQWAAFDRKGHFVVSYYDRAYGEDETTGFSDMTLSGSRDASRFASTRVTTGSMPPPTQFAGGFFGDYSALSADRLAHPVWMDTRDVALFVCQDADGTVKLPPTLCTQTAANADVANEQNVYTRSMAIPLP
ncbi:MAG TPA: sialidase family protein [Solirubrobacteraceae bacterium]|jgi:hypothetical protein|nr:sialidase family protein [Solirubrobacteraceae bacterium]